MIHRLIVVFLLLLQADLFAQDIKIGQWRSHLNYTESIRSEEVKDLIYCATQNGLFSISKAEKTINKLSKTDGFSDVQLSTIEYDKANDQFFIAYQSTSIDIVEGNRIFNVPDIFRKLISGKKVINHIDFHNDKAYISCSFGIVVYDQKLREVRETYSDIGNSGNQVEVFEVCFLADSIFAATSQGILSASLLSPNLLDYKYWKFISSRPSSRIVQYNNKLWAYFDGFIHTRQSNGQWIKFIDSLSGTLRDIDIHQNRLMITYENHLYILKDGAIEKVFSEKNMNSALLDEEGVLWLTVPYYSLIRVEGSKYDYYSPNSPSTKNAWSLEADRNTLWVVAGSLTYTGAPTYNSDGAYYFENGKWENKNYRTTANFNRVVDILTVVTDPRTGHVYFGTYGTGLAEYYNGDIQYVYNTKNSILNGSTIGDSERVNIRGLAFDKDGNLWISNYAAINQITVKKANNTWVNYNIGSGVNRNVGELIIDDIGQKWIILPTDGGIIVFDEKRTSGTKYKTLSKSSGNGNLPSDLVTCLAKDLDGRIWVGTETGIAVFYDPSAVFSGYNFDAQKVWVTYQGSSGYLLESELITCITVDGANNKWIGTRNGVWYVSKDGTSIIYNFTTKNSPLPSDYIRDIAVNTNTGEVFFATDNGIVSFRNTAISGGETFEDVYAFPNPVRPDYKGVIAIRGLVRDANVKITDIAGNMVYETTAEGGLAKWDGKDFSGNEVKSGVYLVLCSNDDATETIVTKILIVR